MRSENPAAEVVPDRTPDIQPNQETEVWKYTRIVSCSVCWLCGGKENSVERHWEKEYMQQMTEDLNAGTAIYADYSRRNAVIYDLKKEKE